MITTICLNPSFDKTLKSSSIRLGELNRTELVKEEVSGKGINVARILKLLNEKVNCIGCLGKDTENYFMSEINDMNISFFYVLLSGKTRTNLKIMDETTKKVTEINELGPSITPNQLIDFKQLLLENTKQSNYIVISGSILSGCPADFYKQIINIMQNKKCILDVSGEAFKLGVEAKPFLVKPNLEELETFVGHKLTSINAVQKASLELIKCGAENVVVSLGEKGALLVNEKEAYFYPPLTVDVKSTAGAGDALVSGIVYALQNGINLKQAVKHGVAMATISVRTMGTVPDTINSIADILNKVEIIPLLTNNTKECFFENYLT